MPKGHEFEGQKDLTAICSDIRLAVLIDNNPKAAMQKRNLLSVPSFCGNPYDLEVARTLALALARPSPTIIVTLTLPRLTDAAPDRRG
jgi:hypothetical protein